MNIRITNKEHVTLIREYAKAVDLPINKAIILAINKVTQEEPERELTAHEILESLRIQFAPKYKNPIK